jgi:anti-sigma-K factor RskA
LSVQHICGEDLELLALGVLAPDESEPLRAHLASCAECSRNFAEAQGRVALFALAAPPQNPSSAAREGLLNKIRAEKIADVSIPARETDSENRAVAVPRRTRWWNSVWVPAAAILAIATVLLWVNDRRLDNQLQEMQNAEQKFELQAEHEKALVAFFSAQDTEAVTLAPKPSVPKSAWAKVRYNSRMGMVCYTGDLPAPPPHMEYQMWIVQMVGKPISAGAFMPASFNDGKMCMAKMPQGIACKAFGVTIEPMGGMPHPTGPVVLASSL